MSEVLTQADPYVNSNLFSSYYLRERVDDLDAWDCDPEAQAVFEDLQEHYRTERSLVETYNEDQLIDAWIDEVLDILGFARMPEVNLPGDRGFVDRLLFDSPDDRRDAVHLNAEGEARAAFSRGVTILEAKQWDADFEKRFNEDRQYRDASHQIKYYLERTPEAIQWGILTNGRKWRLYGTRDYETQTYYEVDLPELLERGSLDEFKAFYLFFRPAAFRETAGTTFLDTIWSESETAAQELGEDLQDNVFTALQTLGTGFVGTNDLGIEADDDAALGELKEQSLVLLYRLMFILYAEARDLIDPDDPTARAEYVENFSLEQLRAEILDEIETGREEEFEREYSEYSTTMWSRMQDLFRLIDNGEPKLDIPAYNGGLFDDSQHRFLADNQVSNRHLAEVIFRLSTTEADDGDGVVAADYADLDTRHLGTIYEGLLEHQFRIAPEDYAAVSENGGQVWKPATEVTVADAVETIERGELYVVNDDGERKATGAYYTPDYVVTYIVEETVDPLLSEIKEDLSDEGFEPGTEEYVYAFSERVFDLKVLDPAMGSGHFLTRATGYLAEAVMAEVRKLELATLFSEEQIRRKVSKECIYGVDLNGMAVELAKLSMWLETLAADQPLAFLDHHLKTGNSLVGSDITEVLSNGDEEENGGQLTLTQAFAQVRRSTLDHVMDLMAELLAVDNETLDDVKSMEELYAEIREDPLYKRLFELANVHTAERFGVDVPETAYEEMAGAIDTSEEWAKVAERDWFVASQATAEEESFFHWELEFPEVFFDIDGRRREDSGFDAVVGNPPYMGTMHFSDVQRKYFKNEYKSATGKWDVYCLFTEKGIVLSNRRLGYIQPTMFMRRQYGEGLRSFISESTASINTLIDMTSMSVFAGATNYVGIFIISTGELIPYFDICKVSSEPELINQSSNKSYTLQNSDLASEPWPVIPPTVHRLITNAPSDFVRLEKITSTISEGIKTGYNNAFVLSKEDIEQKQLEKEITRPFLKGKDIKRYGPCETELVCIYPYRDGKKIDEHIFQTEYPNAFSHLKEYESELKSRPSVGPNKRNWYELERERSDEIYKCPKILTPDISSQNNFTIDADANYYFNTKVKSIRLNTESPLSYKEVVGLLNSKLLEYVYRGISPPKRGGFRAYKPVILADLRVPTSDLGPVSHHVNNLLEITASLNNLNVDIGDYITNYNGVQKLADVGLYQPAGEPNSILEKTKDDFKHLRIGDLDILRESSGSIQINATARYKPDKEVHTIDQWGYTETKPLPAFRIIDLTEREADLIEHFIPLAIEKGDGFANFRDKATKTMSLTDRLEAIEIPNIDDVEDDLERYLKTKERAAELDRKLKEVDSLIDEIVYELYGLTEEEIEIVEEAVKR